MYVIEDNGAYSNWAGGMIYYNNTTNLMDPARIGRERTNR